MNGILNSEEINPSLLLHAKRRSGKNRAFATNSMNMKVSR